MKRIDTSITSNRGTQIPLTIIEPDHFPAKLLICAHGFKAKRTEDGRFVQVAEELAKHGVLSVMPGFPGCDESTDDFINYTLKNCLDDIDSVYECVRDLYELDLSDVGMIGYSMGGRLTCLYIRKHPEISCIGLWASASYDGFGGSDEFLGVPLEQMKKEAEEKGYCDFHNEFDDTDIRLNRELILDMEEYLPMEGLKEFGGSAILVHGDEDVTVPYEVSVKAYEQLVNAKERKLVTVKGADHGFGAWNGRPDLSKILTDSTVTFFKEHLL
ncbi:MAG: prolyl oligopeptidase family serine peptidase [Erysipelotrichaceae bacterium]|nr:prolyl oligopeptidase family serine peptidase [Erysipelotrichaceae bacterium]